MTPELLADLHAIMPEIWLVGAIVAAVLADLVLGERGRVVVTLLGMAGCALALCALTGDVHEPAGRVLGVLSIDSYAVFFRTLIIGGTGLILLHTLVFRGVEDCTRNEMVPMLLGTALGGCLLASTDNLIMLLLSMELLSLCSYLLAGWQRTERRSSEAALKYLVYGAVASAVMTFGFSLLYGLSGSVNMAEIGLAVSDAWSGGAGSGQLVVILATVLVGTGMFFKVAAFPFHFWAPDVYQGAPTPVTTFLAVGSKAAGFAVLVRFVHGVYLGDALNPAWLERLGWMMAVLAAVTMTYGNITAVLQRNVKRLLAYSSIAHAGYLLMGLAVMTSGSADEAVTEGMDSLLFYMASYYVATLGAFGCVMALANRFGCEELDDMNGLAWSAPWTSTFLVIFLVSLTGLPPTVGFIGKWMLFKATLDAGLYWLAVVAALNAVVALFYYFKVARALFLRGDQEVVEGLPSRGIMPGLAAASLAGLAGVAVYYGLMFDDLAAWVSASLL
ncbi:MAG: NADH-quinone oxidoreductase subunit N [Planctomycetota bacterium]|nr:MAG: NADH-quinone oxidoreductase subunit N [Planctomycetota bacterium]